MDETHTADLLRSHATPLGTRLGTALLQRHRERHPGIDDADRVDEVMTWARSYVGDDRTLLAQVERGLRAGRGERST